MSSPRVVFKTTAFERPLVTVDVVIFTVMAEQLCVLLVRRPESDGEPYPARWALPGGFVDVDRDASLLACAERKLRDKTGVAAPYLEQLGSWGDAKRDPRGWSSTHAYFALIPKPEAADGSATTTEWVPCDQAARRRLAFDHNTILSTAIERLRSHPNFHYVEGDISIHSEWIEYHIKKCDVVLPLVAIATPIEYTRNPLRVFELDFEENLKLVRYCVKYNKRVIFPSTSEVYGMCQDQYFDEDTSNLVVGPVNKQRWIYSVSKQLLDRVIWAYGAKGLNFTLFRPFNWMGPRLDRLDSARIGSSRAITQLILNLVEGTPIRLFDGGEQKRCFTDIADGIEALARIIDNDNDVCNGQIINIGNPENEASIRQLGEELLRQFEAHPLRSNFPPFAGFRDVESKAFYGTGYQDVAHRKPSIENAKRLLNWEPTVEMRETIGNTLDFFLREAMAEIESKR